MNSGIEILIERVKTNPEEFLGGRWLNITAKYNTYFSSEESAALKEAMNLLHMEKFAAEVMKELLQEPEAPPPNIPLGSMRYNPVKFESEIFDGKNWVTTAYNNASIHSNPYTQRQALVNQLLVNRLMNNQQAALGLANAVPSPYSDIEQQTTQPKSLWERAFGI